MPLSDDFVAKAEDAGSQVRRVSSWDDVARLIDELVGDGEVALAPRLAEGQPELASLLSARLRTQLDPASVADVAIGVMDCPLGVAETGSVLVREDGLADRAVSMLSRTLVQVVEESDLVPSLDDVAGWLSTHAGVGYVGLVTGPSRTADIERSLTIGVQGPSETYVVLIGDRT